MVALEVWLLSLATIVLVLMLVLGSRRTRKPQAAVAQESLVRDLDLRGGSCAVTAKAFVDAMPEYHRRQYKALRRYTRSGGGVLRLPPDIKAAIVAEYAARRPAALQETEPNFVAFGAEDRRPTLVWLTGSRALRALQDFLQRTLEAWAACGPLEHTATYGVREYRRGARLEQHVDRPHTHAISAIVNIAAEGLENEWPLHLLPHDAAEVCAVKLRDCAADVLLYESASVPHGRLDPLVGDVYANVFLHFRPSGWIDHATSIMGAIPAS